MGLRRGNPIRALSGVSLSVQQGEVVGLVGESGSGKSTLGRIAVGLERPTEGEIHFAGEMHRFGNSAAERSRLLAIQMIFQNAVASLNPRQRVADIIAEPIRVHRRAVRGRRATASRELADRVGLGTSLLRRYPHELSGGQCQRVGIARALSVAPKLLVCDEPVSALDVSIQAQILNLFADLKEQSGYSYLFISHDLHCRGAAERPRRSDVSRAHRRDRAGACAVCAAATSLHASLDGVRAADRRRPQGAQADPWRNPLARRIRRPAARFHPRCPHAMAICREVAPAMTKIGKGHWSACHLHGAAAAPEASSQVT